MGKVGNRTKTPVTPLEQDLKPIKSLPYEVFLDCNRYGDEMQEEQKALSQEGQSLEEFKAHHISDSYKFYSEEI